MRMSLLSVCGPALKRTISQVWPRLQAHRIFHILLHCVLLHWAPTTDSQHWLLRMRFGKHLVIP